MPIGLNKVMVIGQVGRAPEVRHAPSGRAVASCSIGVPKMRTEPGGEQCDETEWFNVVAWDELAELCKRSLTQGSYVYIEGQLHTRVWEDDSGTPCFCVELVAQDILPLPVSEAPLVGDTCHDRRSGGSV